MGAGEEELGCVLTGNEELALTDSHPDYSCQLLASGPGATTVSDAHLETATMLLKIRGL